MGVERRDTEVSEGDGGPRLVMPAPAKVNLVLCIGGTREDGFHDLVSIFQAVEIRDTVMLSTLDAPEIRVTASDARLPCDERNTAYRAARLLRDAHAPDRGVKIYLEKRIPAEAGLGGGSSDAAAVLRGLNALWGLGLSTEALLPFAAAVGSDVPFFLSAGCALVRGRGERVEPLPCSLDAHLVIAKPAVGVSTARAYAELDALRAGRVPEPCDDAIATMRAALERGDRAGVVRALRNDLEAPVLAMHPEIAGLKAELLARGAEGALLSGSGSAVFGLFATEDAARECAGALAERWPWVCVARPWRSR